MFLAVLVLIPISIHAPVRGATVARYILKKQVGISIHAPVRGATAILTNFSYSFLYTSITSSISQVIFSQFFRNTTFFSLLFHPFSGANPPGISCLLPIRTTFKESKYHPVLFPGPLQYVPPLFDIYFPGNKTSNYLPLYQ